MNFISRMEGQEVQVELKYCERCGGLWLRPHGTDGIYCAPCRVRLASAPNPSNPSRPLRKPRRRKKYVEPHQQADVQSEGFQGPGRIDYLQGVAAMGVWA